MGLFGIAEIIHNLEKGSAARGRSPRPSPALADARGFPRVLEPVLRGTVLGSLLGVLPGGGAVLSVVRRLHAGEEARERSLALRPGRHRGRGRAGIGQQCRRADLVHSAADARHSAQRGDGADGRRHDDPRHRAGPAGDDRAARPVLGPDRQHVDRQSDAGRPQPAADRHLGAAAAGALSLLYPAILVFCCIGVYSVNQSATDVLFAGRLRPARLPLHQAAMRAGAAACSASCSGR